MRYLHPVQAHEKYQASGRYRFFKNGSELRKTEAWTIHELGDGSRFIRVDIDAQAEEGKSVLAEALQNADGEYLRFDIRYENATFEGGVKALSASYSFADTLLQVGFSLNGTERAYMERQLPPKALIDIPLLIMRGEALMALSNQRQLEVAVFVPMYEHAQLFPGVSRMIESPVECLGEETVAVGKREMCAKRFRYRDQAASYWVDEHAVVLKRVNAYKQNEFVVRISDYAQAK